MEEDYISKLKHVSKLDFQSKVDVINTGRPTPELKVDWSWASWQLWGGCSDSCGGGERMRVRLCNSPPRGNGGRPCPGDSSQLSRCNAHACPGGPQSARGSIVGNINDIEFGISILNATVTDGQSGGRTVTATITNVPRTLGPAMRTLVSILNPVYWTAAQEVGEAVNALTGSVFRRETQVEFATGETLRMTLAARGLDSDGALLLDIVVNGHVLQLPSHADISIKTVQEFNSLVALYREQLISPEERTRLRRRKRHKGATNPTCPSKVFRSSGLRRPSPAALHQTAFTEGYRPLLHFPRAVLCRWGPNGHVHEHLEGGFVRSWKTWKCPGILK
ncbi:hemicentin-1-like isoform X3 [Pseudoliparis swirei]|uniref:hemicentin-1-like isoform X3 n=1 Tax=Pseudoliparis swirei TaxID=2059687 RepID=UPI0024BEFC63|nr:hemicentin-1-like isoform X3 [Pseudoliparis swirei]